MEKSNGKGIKRTRLDLDLNLLPDDDFQCDDGDSIEITNPPCPKRLNAGNGSGFRSENIQSGDGDSFEISDPPCTKRLNAGSGSGFRSENIQSDDGDSFEISNPFNLLSDEVLILMLTMVCATASSPADLIKFLLVNKRFGELALAPEVLKTATGKCCPVRAKNWSECARQFLACCANAGNLEACYFLGMVEFYCLANHVAGFELLQKAAQGSHAEALYSLAIIYFNGSGSLKSGFRRECDPDSAAHFCMKSAKLGNLDAIHEAAYCFQYGLGLPFSPMLARRLRLEANTRELTESKNTSNPCDSPNDQGLDRNGSLLTNYGFYEIMDVFYEMIGKEVHPANKFMVEWWWLASRGDGPEDGLNMCSNVLCGRRETRSGGFRRCRGCRQMSYCSHACQEMHWKMEHMSSCNGQAVPGELVRMEDHN